MSFKDHFLQFFIALDQVLNTVFGGWADESLSSRAHRLSEKGKTWPKKLIDAIFFWQKDHCKESYESELERSQLPPSMRE